MKNEDYRPKVVEFDVAHDGSNVPMTFGEFKNPEEVTKFLSQFTAINQSLTVSRHMDNFEKSEIRKEVNDLLENQLPAYERDLSAKTQTFNTAKKAVADAQEMVNATMNQAKTLAMEVKRGLVDLRLDDMFTSRIPYKGRYYFFTYMDGELKLCAIRDIPEDQKSEIWNAMAKNDEIIDTNFANVETTA